MKFKSLAVLLALVAGAPAMASAESEEAFITEHYWGYTRRTAEVTGEYRVVHVPWRVQSAPGARFEGDPALVYGPEWAPVLSRPPVSAFFAEGSPVMVMGGSTTAVMR